MTTTDRTDHRAAQRRDARPLRRAGARLRPGEPLLRRGLRGAQGVRLPERRPAHRAGRAGPAPRRVLRLQCAASPTTRRPPRWPSTCTSTGPAWPPTCAQAGDDSCRFILEKAAAGEVFAALHGEAGNDIPLLLSSATAERVDGGWEISGHKIFGSLTPVWTYGGFHAMDTSDPAGPRIVHGFLPRARPAATRSSTRGTPSGCGRRRARTPCSTRRSSPTSWCPLVCPAGFAGAGLFQVAIFAWALMGFASVYLGAARRAFDLTIERMPQRTSVALTRSMAHHPEVQHHVAEMRMAYDAAEALLERTTADWATGVEHADWPVRLVGTRQVVINNAYNIVDRALDLSGGAGAFKRNRLEQIFRDVRMGRFHPGQLDAGPRADRQALPRHQPRRPPALGLRRRPAAGTSRAGSVRNPRRSPPRSPRRGGRQKMPAGPTPSIVVRPSSQARRTCGGWRRAASGSPVRPIGRRAFQRISNITRSSRTYPAASPPARSRRRDRRGGPRPPASAER